LGYRGKKVGSGEMESTKNRQLILRGKRSMEKKREKNTLHGPSQKSCQVGEIDQGKKGVRRRNEWDPERKGGSSPQPPDEGIPYLMGNKGRRSGQGG